MAAVYNPQTTEARLAQLLAMGHVRPRTTGQTVTVLTYPTYLVNAGKVLAAKGVKVIIPSPTPNNICESGTCSYTPSRFTTYSKDAANKIGSGAMFVDHGQYTANI